tara:strand:+ start:1907 stop:2176 length:270 start_codon:yes stop_codon:yes gene_type:complete
MDKIDKGEIVYCNMKVEFDRNNRKIIKNIDNCIFSRPWTDDNYPYLDVVNFSRFINKLEKNKKHKIENIKVINLDIITRTGYINKYANR